MDNSYFSRCGTWHRIDGRLVVNDSRSARAPRVITMDQWPEVVFMAADGEHTVGELVAAMGAEYPEGVPAGLREQIQSIVSSLVDEGIVRLHASPRPLPPYLAEDHFAAPPELRRQQMKDDGFI